MDATKLAGADVSTEPVEPNVVAAPLDETEPLEADPIEIVGSFNGIVLVGATDPTGI